MENQLFRQKSIDRISSPEQLHDYMRVTSPKLWMILSAIIVLMVGLIVLASTATMESTMKVQRASVVFTDDADDLPDGLYDGEIVIERRTPISFLLN